MADAGRDYDQVATLVESDRERRSCRRAAAAERVRAHACLSPAHLDWTPRPERRPLWANQIDVPHAVEVLIINCGHAATRTDLRPNVELYVRPAVLSSAMEGFALPPGIER